MHIEYTPESVDFWVHFYKASIDNHPQYHLGGELDGFRAYYPPPHQRGAGLGSFFRSLYRFMLPVFKSAGKHALTAGSKIAADLAEGQKFQDSALKHGREAAGEVLHETATKISGKGLGKRKRSEKPIIKINKKRMCIKSSSFNNQTSSRAVGSDIFGDYKKCQSY